MTSIPLTDPHEIATELRHVVGTRNVEDDPGIMDAYAFNWNADNLTGGKSKFARRPLCVVLPGTTPEVLQIVRFCNARRLQFKAQSTGWGVHNSVGKEGGVILLDLRRMNHFWVDSKNMIAVVEPYFNGAMMQAEIFKLGLNCHIAGCGANASLLASVTSMVGQGWTGVSTGFSNRNILGAEWVMPDGTLCQVGSWGSIAKSAGGVDEKTGYKDIHVNPSEWFLADGPGPSLRGVYRGFFGAFGGMGVFTKAAVKLYPWRGPPRLEIEGNSPAYNLVKKKLPKWTAVYAINWQTWEDFKVAGLALAQSEVCWALCRNAGFIVGLAGTPNNNEFLTLFNQLLKGVKYNLLFVTMAGREREYAYHKKVVSAIIKETRGEDIPLAQDPFFASLIFMVIAKQCNTMRGVFRAGGGFFTSLGALGSWDWCVEGAKVGEQLKRAAIAGGGIIDDGADNVWGLPYENGNFSHLEELYMYDVTDPASRQASVAYLKSVADASLRFPLGIGLGTVDGEGSQMHNRFGPVTCNYHKWLKAIKKAFDPNNAADPCFYADPDIIKD